MEAGGSTEIGGYVSLFPTPLSLNPLQMQSFTTKHAMLAKAYEHTLLVTSLLTVAALLYGGSFLKGRGGSVAQK